MLAFEPQASASVLADHLATMVKRERTSSAGSAGTSKPKIPKAVACARSVLEQYGKEVRGATLKSSLSKEQYTAGSQPLFTTS